MFYFSGFDNSCDLSAVLGILANASVFQTRVQTISKDVRSEVRNEWGHCNFDHWTDPKMTKSFQLIENLLCALGLPKTLEAEVLADLDSWKKKGKLSTDVMLLVLVFKTVAPFFQFCVQRSTANVSLSWDILTKCLRLYFALGRTLTK